MKTTTNPAAFKALMVTLIFLSQMLTPLMAVQFDDSLLIEKAKRIHKKIISFDTHNDSALKINKLNLGENVNNIQVTFPMMKHGGLDGAFFAIYIGQKSRASDSVLIARNYVDSQLLKFKNYVERSDDASVVTSAKEIIQNKNEGRISVLLALENGYPIGKDISQVKRYYNMGVRAITLCHNLNNDICDSSMDSVTEHKGLSEFGYRLVKEMNRLGMIIDVSHASSETLSDIFKVTALPVIASHSGAYSLKNHKRNLRDNEIWAIASTGGLIQVASGKFFLSDKPKEEVSVKDLADHIDHIRAIAGIEHIGLGTDFDGGGGVVGMEDASKMINLTVELLKRGYTHRDLELFWGGNLIRIMKIHFM